MTPEPLLRDAALRSIDRFCRAQGFDIPPLEETATDGGRVVQFVGEAPDGRRFGIGYERYPPGRPCPHPPAAMRVVHPGLERCAWCGTNARRHGAALTFWASRGSWPLEVTVDTPRKLPRRQL